ncbi:MAG: PLDc N-terminal domain-containing protein [Nanoarchaeota archaeon]|nr:PLDc N-terminal domain-containing protein [Nanoarchaeota archaeon]
MGSGIFGLIALICAIWVIYDVWVARKKMKVEMKIVWTICAVLFNIITAIVYYFIGRK